MYQLEQKKIQICFIEERKKQNLSSNSKQINKFEKSFTLDNMDPEEEKKDFFFNILGKGL